MAGLRLSGHGNHAEATNVIAEGGSDALIDRPTIRQNEQRSLDVITAKRPRSSRRGPKSRDPRAMRSPGARAIAAYGRHLGTALYQMATMRSPTAPTAGARQEQGDDLAEGTNRPCQLDPRAFPRSGNETQRAASVPPRVSNRRGSRRQLELGVRRRSNRPGGSSTKPRACA